VPDQWWVDDDRLLQELGEALRHGEVPDSFVVAGKLAYPFDDLDAELAALLYDSAADRTPATAGTRSDELASLRQLTYRAARAGVEIELGVAEDAIVGQVVPPQAATVEVDPARGERTTVTVNEAGGFVVRPIPPTPFRLRFRLPAGVMVVTDWVTLADPWR
jgi:hypothetical protein